MPPHESGSSADALELQDDACSHERQQEKEEWDLARGIARLIQIDRMLIQMRLEMSLEVLDHDYDRTVVMAMILQIMRGHLLRVSMLGMHVHSQSLRTQQGHTKKDAASDQTEAHASMITCPSRAGNAAL